ncbi:MAG TPA: MBL fold metallo-hydrolase [Denitromonas sp.]|uniref:MBL fold metallo-hydrolase n=1 Tax=Denitromonas sp. TaxID=2734609 RepID=UPI002B9ABD43|nr:MBL fold metallo-hydrolase [Zoogloeaceae bacterium]HPR06018.1 MBL fold metallo-hydrolase [Denitromonas sp.]HQU90008.1 MBL fold metallo-hydrolase [Denitromonas sp.]HQV16094.1 MBL fold metallo-hydrolase [Denitromonas sp.]
MYFRQIFHSPSHSISYLLADVSARDAVLIDPLPEQSELLLALLQERDLRLRYVLRTHMHSAQQAHCGELCRFTGAELVTGADTPYDGPALRKAHGDTVVFGSEALRVLATPGHTPDSVCFLWRDRLFCGDTLAIGGCSLDAALSDPGRLYDSVTQRLFLLPGETLMFPGHDFNGRTVSTITEERHRNAAFAAGNRETFLTANTRRPGHSTRPESPLHTHDAHR